MQRGKKEAKKSQAIGSKQEDIVVGTSDVGGMFLSCFFPKKLFLLTCFL